MKTIIRFSIFMFTIAAIFFSWQYVELSPTPFNGVQENPDIDLINSVRTGIFISFCAAAFCIVFSLAAYRKVIPVILLMLSPTLFFAQDSTVINPDFTTIGGMDAAFGAIIGALTILWGYVAKALNIQFKNANFVFTVLAGGIVIAGAFIIGTMQGESISEIIPRAVIFLGSVITAIGTHSTFIRPFERKSIN